MGDFGCGETRVLRKTTLKESSFNTVAPNPTRPVRFLISRRQAAKEKNNAAFPDGMEILPASHSPPSTTYGYLDHIQSLKPELTADGKSLPKKVR
jgi:hypothetical protein